MVVHERAGLCGGRPDQRAHHVQLRGVFTRQLRRPSCRGAATGVSPHCDGGLPAQLRDAVVAGRRDGGAQAVEHVVPGLAGHHPKPVRSLVVADGDHPSFGECGHHQQEFVLRLGQAKGSLLQVIRREPFGRDGVDGALEGQ